jgi:hypothetical protein
MSASESELIVDIDSFEKLYTNHVSTHTGVGGLGLTGTSGSETINKLVLVIFVRVIELEAVAFLANNRRI